jgi:hypothetical protein
MRVYAPATTADLVVLARDGAWSPVAGAYAVTPSLRGWVVADGPTDDEELELAAMSEAARASLRLLAPPAAADARRVVVALDLPADSVAVDDEGPDDPPGRVRLSVETVPVARVASVHVDEPDAVRAVAAAAAAVQAADAEDLDAEAVVATLDDHDLLWYDPAELTTLLGSPGSTG